MFRCHILRLKQDRRLCEVADATGGVVGRQTIARIEKGRINPTADELAALAKALKFDGDPARLLDRLDVTRFLEEGAESRDGQRERREAK